jgi:hypothetical protein
MKSRESFSSETGICPMLTRASITRVGLALVLRLAGAVALAGDSTQIGLERQFRDTVHPFLQDYCFHCHDQKKHKGDLDLSSYSSLDAVCQDFGRWETVIEKLKAAEMPPEEADQKPAPKLRRGVIEWIQAVRANATQHNAGDPGLVLARRLNNAEYNYTIRDLTGIDMQPTREFPVDPANQAGFDNSGESLAMSPALLKKYLDAAQFVAEHLVLKPDGFVFAPFSAVTDPDRDRFAVKPIVQFYQRQPTNYVDYFMACWRFKNRVPLGNPKASLVDFAAEGGVSPKYLATVWSTLTGEQESIGPIAALQAMWRKIPAAEGAQPADCRAACKRMRDFVVTLRQAVKPEFANLAIRGVHPGAQALVLWKDRQYATNRMRYIGGALQLDPDELSLDADATHALAAPANAPDRERYEASFQRFCAIFPDAFYIAQRARVYLDSKEEKANEAFRPLSAGFHSQMGYFRDDAPLCELILSPEQKRELDNLWRELDFITLAPVRQYREGLWFERTDSKFLMDPEFAFAQSADNDSTSEAKVRQLAAAYVAKVRRATTNEMAIRVIQQHFEMVNANIRAVERDRLAAEPSHLAALQDFAQRAYRRPLSGQERDDIVGFYRSLRKEDGLDHDEAVRATLASILMSPDFSYRIVDSAPGVGIQPLSDYELASRLSYFLWSSMPDRELLDHAAAGDLHRRKVLLAQTRRMLEDERVQDLATEFGGNWLDFRRFQEHNAVDRERFKTFNNDLREAMFEEPIHFLVDVIREDRSVLDFLYAKRTFVNPILAKHYGMPDRGVQSNQWVRIDDASPYQRGGLLPMSVFLTMNAPGLRTSPVKRGYWVVRRLLGERIPPPPPTVPALPTDEANLGELTLRQTLERHRADKNCAGCHARFDSIGLVFEGYGPVGEVRTKDFAGHPVQTRATFPGGGEGDGLDGLRSYLRQHRQDEFLDNLCRKMLAYGLGRGLTLSDTKTIEEMRAKLASNGYRFSNLIETVVTSRQFLNKRGQAGLAAK